MSNQLRPASARPPAHGWNGGGSDAEAPAASPVRPASAAVTRVPIRPSPPPATADSRAHATHYSSNGGAFSFVPPHARSDKPPFRPSSARPRDAHSGAAAGRERSPGRSPTNRQPQSPTESAAHSVADTVGPLPRPASAAAPAVPTPATLHPPGHIPVRHTRRTSEFANRSVGASPEATHAVSRSFEWTDATVRSHFEPLLASRHSKLADLRQRYQKQQSRLLVMQTWKSKALDQANSEANPLDFVLGPDGTAVESTRVRQKRIVLQRTLIRQFLRTFRLLRGLKVVHRHLRSMVPMLLHSPNSRVHAETRMLLREVISTWEKEPLPTGALGAPATASPKKTTRFGFDRHAGGGGSRPRDGGSSSSVDGGKASADSSRQAASAAEFHFFKSRPHLYTSKLLANLFDVVPLVSRCIDENLRAKRASDERNYRLFTENTRRIDEVTSAREEIASRKEAIRRMRDDVDLIDSELARTRDAYVETVDQLESTVRQEHILLRKVNTLYYKEVSEKLGEPYAVQLSIAQQGQPYNTSPAASNTQATNTTSTTARTNDAPTTTTSPTHLFVPSSFQGATLPQPPSTVPIFVRDSSAAGAEGARGSFNAPPTIFLTPHLPLPSSTRTVEINKAETLREVDHLLQRYTSSSSSPRHTAQQTGTAADMPAVTHALLDEGNDHPGLSPFFVLHPPDEGINDDDAAGDESDADELFDAQRAHFSRDVADESPVDSRASLVASEEEEEGEEEEEKEEEKDFLTSLPVPSPTASTSSREPFFDASLARIPPLHARTISEIDWLATGPNDLATHRLPSGGGATSAADREAQAARASKLANPFVRFPSSARDEAAARHEASTALEKGFAEKPQRDLMPPEEWWSRRQDYSAIPSPMPSPRDQKPPPPPAPTLPPSPVPGLSPETYHLAYQQAVASLLRLGYPSQQALDFAPHLVLVGAVQAPAKVEPVTEPQNVATLARLRQTRRTASTSTTPMPTLPAAFRPVLPVAPSDEEAWGTAAGAPYIAAAPSRPQPPVRPSSAVAHHARTASLVSSRSSGGVRTAKPSRPASAVGAAARTQALYSGVPTTLADYMQQKA